jgi:hypothetical protein
MNKQSLFQLDEQKIRDAFGGMSPGASEEQWKQLERNLDALGAQRKSSFRQRVQRLGFIVGLVILGGSLVAFINFNKRNSTNTTTASIDNDEVIVADKFSEPTSTLVMSRPVAEPKKIVVIVPDSVAVNSVDTLSGSLVSNDKTNVVAVKPDTASVSQKKESAPEPKKKKKRKKKKRRPAAHNASDDDVIISG